AADGTLYAVVVNSDGTTTETEVHTNKNTSQCLITDGQGDSLVISKNGQPMGIKEYRATGGNKALLKEYHRKSDSLAQWQINFTKYDAQTYAFDRVGSGNHGIFATDEYYPKSGSYDFRYKSVESGKSDRVVVDFGSYPEKDSVIFKDKYGVKLKVVDGNILAFTGVSKADTNFIYAYRGDQKIGKLFLNTYQKKTYKVVLISVNGAKLPNVKDLENYLNKVYRQCADSFKIETRDLQVSGIENFTHGGTKVAGSVWNASQKAVLEAFGEKYEDNTAYLFFIPKAETGGVAGYMPRYYPYGFIYPGAANRTIAHELGHGIAGLEHPFPESQVSGSTQNLMDYRDGTELWHFQWDMLQDPSRKIFKWWQNEEDAEAFDLGANIVCITDEEIQKIKATQRYFYIADGRVVDLKDYNPSGFYTMDDKTESARGAVAKIRIDGYDYGMYYNKDTKQVSFFGYNTDPDHAAKKVEVAKLIVNDPEKIKLAQRVFPSDNTCDCKNFVTPENNVFKTLYAEMSEEDYTEAVDRLVSRLNAQVEKENYLAVDGDADQSNEAKDYRDRLEVFHSATNNSIYVDVCCFNKKPTAEQISKMAKDVFEKSTLKDDDKSIYLVLPVWSEHKIKNDLRSYDKQYFSRSFYTKSQKYSGIKDHDNYKNITGNPIEVIDKIYRLVPKPYVALKYVITCDGNILRLSSEKKTDFVGSSLIYDLNILCDKSFEEFARLTYEINIDQNDYIIGYGTPQQRHNPYSVEALQKKIERRKVLLSDNQNVEYFPINHGIKQSALELDAEGRCPTAEQFIQWYVSDKMLRWQNPHDISDDVFLLGRNQVVYDRNLMAIDVASVLLMPFGLDLIPEAIGCIYTGYYGDWSNTTLYTVGFIGIGVPSAVTRHIPNIITKKSKIVWENKTTYKIVDNADNIAPSSKLETTIVANTDHEKQMTNILADVSGKRQIGNELVDYDDLFKKYFNHLDPETLAKFDKQMRDTWHKMMDKNMPEAWCRNIDIVEQFNQTDKRLIQRWDNLQSYNHKPEILLKDFDKFAEFDQKMAYSFKRMNELNAPNSWLVDYDYVKSFNAHHERSCEFLEALTTNKISIDDFDSFMLFVEYAEKYRPSSISFANLGKTMHYADSRLTKKVVAEYIRTLKSPLTRDLPPNTFRAMVGDFEHIDGFSNFKVKDIENLFGRVHETEVRKLLEHTTLKVRSSGKYLAKDKIQAFVAGCMSAAASKFILWRYDSKNWNKDWSEFFNEITTKINDPESYAFDFWGDMLKDGLANTVTKKRPILGCLTNTDYSKIYLGITNDELFLNLLKEAFNCFIGWVIDKAKNSEFVQEEMLTVIFNGGVKMKLWTKPLEDLITDLIKNNWLYPENEKE
ncbi:MAG: hypothetical protein II939_12965, partial [Bacteroidales bacterium]|nr:hypothetical protein [Bacteroidales bacterium]